MEHSYDYVRFFKDIGLTDVSLVGGKNASLGELYRELAPKGVLVPNGFAVTAEGYRSTLQQAGVWPRLHTILDPLDPSNIVDLAQRAHQARELVYSAPLPLKLADDIRRAYQYLKDEYGPALAVAVRSSATAEDLPNASFAGQHESYLNIIGEQQLLDAVSRCFSSLFTDRAIRYRINNGFDHYKVFNSVGVMKMVRSDLSSSGVVFSIDTETGFPGVVFITGAYGLGENVVQGAVDPDEFYVFKPTFAQGKRIILRRSLGAKQIKMVYAQGGSRDHTRNVPTDKKDQETYCISDEEALLIADYAIKIERHYSEKAGENRPMDVEWAKDGTDGKIYVVQARPETVTSKLNRTKLEEYRLISTGPILATGRAVGTKIASGKARVISSPSDLATFQPGEILVSDTTSPDWGTVMKAAAAIVTNRGGRTCHAAIVARELGVPAIVGTDNATRAIRTGDPVTVSCAEGITGKIYEGLLPFEIDRADLSEIVRPRTKIMMNVGDPDQAFALSFLPNDGVGLARMEFIISNFIKVHPMALIDQARLSPTERNEIARLTQGYETPSNFFIERLSEGIGTIAAAFYPKPVIVRLSDFKTNEYASLIGGRTFEIEEANPMIGFRGASRYTHPAYEPGFALECAALKRARNDMGLTNIIPMIPFCRRVEEAQRVIDRMSAYGLSRGEDGLEIYVMCEIPNNVILIDEFAQHFDGFSIGSNDLTQLVLGVDRDSEIISFDFDERDPGVMKMIALAVEGARRNSRHSSICGQAPSDYPDVAEYLVRLGIDSISLNPDSILKTTMRVIDLEAKLGRSRMS